GNPPTVVGGIHASSVPDYVLSDPHIDYVIRGEGEDAFLELAAALERGEDPSGVANLWSKRPDGSVVANEVRPTIADIDKIPFPEKDLWVRAGAINRTMMVIGTRGCPYQCTYCENHFLARLYKDKGRFVRYRSPENIGEELRLLDRRYKFRRFYFVDGTFNLNPPWLDEVLAIYKREVRKPFACDVVSACMRPGMARKLADAGCEWVYMGFDSGDTHMRNEVLKKGTTDYELIEAVRQLQAAGVKVQCSTLLAVPGESEEEMRSTVAFVERLRPDIVSTYLLYPFPATDIARYAEERGLIDEAGKEAMRRGDSSYHQQSLLAHPLKPLAFTISKLLPLYNVAPGWLRWALRRVMARPRPRLANAIYLATAPAVYPVIGRSMIRDLLGTIWKASFGRPAAPAAERA
ncbi:MAG: B12-binding domain-containing radical SAM protein, partial [Candidatus Methylomirabilis sp.]|nr:B12-binding domain-containing radical SAM protein [Deltaproteobacteria bacterium]